MCSIQYPSFEAWLYAIAVHGSCCVFGALPLSVVLYHLRQPRHASTVTTTKATTTTTTVDKDQAPSLPLSISLLVASFLAVVVAVVVARYKTLLATRILQPPNEAMLWMGHFLLSTFGFATCFKTWHAAWGQYPAGADATLYTWILWFLFLPEPKFAKEKMFHVTSHDILVLCRNFVIKLFVLGLLLSFLNTSPSHTFLAAVLPTTTLRSLPIWFATTVNGFVHLWMLYLFAAFCLDFSVLANTVTSGGLAMEGGFANPLLESRSLREAWGTRWNKPVQLLLQRMVYIPVRRSGSSRTAAALLTFAASGLLHEYNFSVHNGEYYQPGRATVFFIAMGALMLAEQAFYRSAILPTKFQNGTARVPTIVISVMWSLVAAWPFERYFIPSWRDAGMIASISQLFPTLHCNQDVAPNFR